MKAPIDKHLPATTDKPTRCTRVWGVMAAALIVFPIALGFVTAGDNVLASDVRFSRWVQQWQGSAGQTLYDIGDMLGTTAFAAIVVVLGLVVALAMRWIQIAIFLTISLILRLVGTQFKPVFDSPRPIEDHVRLLETFDGTGYPSGHSMTVAMVATMTVMIAWRYLKDSRLQWLVTIVAGIGILLVGWSRVWSGAHWPSDVLGGWSFGIGMVLVAWMLSNALMLLWPITADTTAEPATHRRG